MKPKSLLAKAMRAAEAIVKEQPNIGYVILVSDIELRASCSFAVASNAVGKLRSAGHLINDGDGYIWTDAPIVDEVKVVVRKAKECPPFNIQPRLVPWLG